MNHFGKGITFHGKLKQSVEKFFVILLFIAFISGTTFCADTPNYYRAPHFNATKSWLGTPYRERNRPKNHNWTSIFDIHLSNGSTHRARNCNGDSTGTFDLYGNHNLLYLTTGVPQPSPISSTLLGYVNDLNTQRLSFENANPADKETFGQVEFHGKTEITEFVINYRQNLIHNFFTELNIPIRRIVTGPLTLVDKSPYSGGINTPYTQTDTAWINFVTNLEDILSAYGAGCYQPGYQNTSFGDITFFGGWQNSINKPTAWLEYIKYAVKFGFLLPSGSQRKSNKPFSLEHGYNGHLGFPIRLDAIFGLSDDIYIGAYAGTTFFSSKTHKNYPVQTHERQNGFIKLYRTKVREKRGTIFDIGTYIKLDHFFKGLSTAVGYSYNREANNSLSLADSCVETNNMIINKDQRLKSWHQHVLHVFVDYDMGVHNFFKTRKWSPRIGVFYDHPFDGKRVIITPMFGASCGCNIAWNF